MARQAEYSDEYLAQCDENVAFEMRDYINELKQEIKFLREWLGGELVLLDSQIDDEFAYWKETGYRRGIAEKLMQDTPTRRLMYVDLTNPDWIEE